MTVAPDHLAHGNGSLGGRQPISISVLIPTARALATKRGTIADLLRVCIRRLPVREIIVVGQPDRQFLSTRTELSAPVRVIRDARVERNYLRNLALRNARSTHVMFLDDDTIVVPHRGARSDIRRVGLQGMATFADRRYLPLDECLDSFLRTAASKGWGPSIRDLPVLTTGINRETDWYTSKITFPTNFCIAATEFMRRLGGLDESYVGWGYEDVDLANRVLAEGPIRFCRESITAIHIDHLVHPEQERQAQANYRRFVARRASDRTMPCISAGLFGIAGKFVGQLGPLRPSGKGPIERGLRAVPHFELNEADRQYAAARVHEITAGYDLVGIAVYGSAATHSACRDVDLCVMVGHCRDTFTVDRMPSGKELEVHLTCLPSICSQLRKVFYLGDNAYLIYFKFKGMRLLHDFRGLARRYLGDCLRGDGRVLPYMTSLYVGLADLALEKRATADQLTLGRYLAAIAMIGGRECPTREVVLSRDAAREWLARETLSLTPGYLRAAKSGAANEWLLYPPNYRGHALLGGATLDRVVEPSLVGFSADRSALMTLAEAKDG